MAETPIPTEKGPLPVTVSIGVAGMTNGEGLTLDLLLERADQAMYTAKQAGRNRVQVLRSDAQLSFAGT